MNHIRFRQEARRAAMGTEKGKACLLLSGGVDSAVIAEALAPIDAFSVALGDYDNEEITRARRIAADLHLSHSVIKVQRSKSEAERVARWCIRRSGAVKKASIETCMLLLPAVEKICEMGYRVILHGMDWGPLWGLNKSVVITQSKEGDGAWTKARAYSAKVTYAQFPPTASMLLAEACASRRVQWRDPLMAPGVVGLMLSLSFAQLNRPHPKSLARLAFACACRHAKPMNAQIGSGARSHADVVAKELGFTTARAWYSDIAQQENVYPNGTDALAAIAEATEHPNNRWLKEVCEPYL